MYATESIVTVTVLLAAAVPDRAGFWAVYHHWVIACEVTVEVPIVSRVKAKVWWAKRKKKVEKAAIILSREDFIF